MEKSASTKDYKKCLKWQLLSRCLLCLIDVTMIWVKCACQHHIAQDILGKWGGFVWLIDLITCFFATYTCTTKYVGMGKLLLCFSTGRICIWWPHCTPYNIPVISWQLPLMHVLLYLSRHLSCSLLIPSISCLFLFFIQSVFQNVGGSGRSYDKK